MIRYVDSNACLGKRGVKDPRAPWSRDDLLAMMRRTGIAGALVWHGLAREYAPAWGNRALTEEIEGQPRLAACWTLMPDHAGDFPPAEAAVRELRARGARAATLFPRSHKFLTDEAAIGPLLRALEAEGVPLLLDAAETGIEAAGDIALRHPGLDVLLQNVWWGQERVLFPVMDRAPRLCADLSCLQANRIVETMAARYGPGRIMFGTGMPMKSPGAARALIDWAALDPEAKGLIAGGNLARLTGFDPPPADPVEGDALTAAAESGAPLPAKIFDSHAHFLEEGGTCGGGQPMIGGGVGDMVAAYEPLGGLDKFALAPWLGIWADSEAGNALAADAMRRWPGRAFGYVLIDPNYVADVGAEARKWHLGARMPGVKMFYERIKTRYNDPVFRPWWELANDRRLFALLDPGGYGSFLRDAEELMDAWPQVTFFLDHAARSWSAAVECAAAAKRHPNCMLQLTYTTVTEGAIEWLASEIGAGRLLYGTDAPMRDPRPQLGWLVWSGLPEADKRRVLHDNMEAVLARCFP